MSAPVRGHRDGTVVLVRAVPGASSAGIVGVQGGELRIRVCSPPVDGRANDELRAVLAAAIGVRPRLVTVLTGQHSRSKQLLVALEEPAVRRALGAWIGGSEEFQR